MNDRPKRIQMHRRKGGWRKDHPDAVIVARPSKWGNPFSVEDAINIARIKPEYARKFSVQCFGDWIRGDRQNWMGPESDAAAAKITANFSELRGKDLACWCPLDQPCHADVLLEIANAPNSDRKRGNIDEVKV